MMMALGMRLTMISMTPFSPGRRRGAGFFFSSRRRHPRLQGDWSSDVCSSDLFGEGAADRDIAEGQRTQGAERQDLRSASGTDGDEPEIEAAGGGVQRCKDRDPADAEVVIVGDQKIA